MDRNTTHNSPNDAVRQAMRQRCDEEGHSWDNCCDFLLHVYQQCKWCGEQRPVRYKTTTAYIK